MLLSFNFVDYGVVRDASYLGRLVE
ncbi:hypothetical protein AGR8A_Cc60399 [Agrobacterium fabrum str. J-07]|nr:hypothetical protein AGR8A_Cc60399 [Agrobacterium fabrum str. J-07]